LICYAVIYCKTYNQQLIEACKNGFFPKVKRLVNDKLISDLNFTDNSGWTPLHYASIRGNYDIAEFLIEKGADINSKYNDGWTPLHYASYRGYIEIVKIINKERC